MLKNIIITIAAIAILFSIFDYRVSTMTAHNTQDHVFVIAPGDNLFAIGQHLAQQDLIGTRYYFYYYAWKERLRGQTKAGEYTIPAHATLAEVAYLITEGKANVAQRAQVRVTFPEGMTIDEMGVILIEHHLPGEDFVARAKNPSAEMRARYDFVPQEGSLEGYLFPDTYDFFRDADADDIIGKLLDIFDHKVPAQERADLAAAANMPFADVVTLASVVEGEVREGMDRTLVAGVFMNRLKAGVALQSDATIDYITGEPEVKHTLDDLAIDSPYNTYLYPGLPQGPINNPSKDSLYAAAHPADTEYFYFLNNADTGETVFSTTLEEHAVNKTQNGL